MATRIKISLLLFLVLLIYSYSGVTEGFSDNANSIHSLHKNGVPMNSRKLLVVNKVLDYDYTGPNPKHDPRKGKPGNGGKNP
ncbi:hypothetical protein CEY00_Acc20325 [Actinidia chinensis var. chinensis]|uniref:Transmembrane protein n=1 Tax=Actinidia chinensis var. chinensis TaxID=1590841 RepID=A0A2R6Q990_ACTCC|nr:hypothetical protein CEY00_Acc20323 [Actinidia chinensis var. chinensis]PSS04471.1 hypothetical protein CEY00_Acc20325 [Actinidia chinensis var. chinensis]